MYPLGLDSNATLFELQALRILRLEELAFKQTGKRAVVPWYIMTSSGTQSATLQFFKDHSYWGLKPENVVLFQQNEIPSLLENGKMLLADKDRLVRAPDGNGGLYSSVRSCPPNLQIRYLARLKLVATQRCGRRTHCALPNLQRHRR
jgi:UDP-N-acetylglucosamine/UDP-N-acetylgalactosamine diphosphorylase